MTQDQGDALEGTDTSLKVQFSDARIAEFKVCSK